MNKYKVGIGICTYNRRELLKVLIQRVRSTVLGDYMLLVADDGSTDGTIDMLKQLKISYVVGPNGGATVNKNRLLLRLKDCDYIFILEDDMLILKSGWVEFYIGAYEASAIHHLLFCPSWYFSLPTAPDDTFGKYVIRHPKDDGGVFAFYTKKIIGTCGGYHPDFRGYGWGHCEFTERIHRAGLAGKHKINHVVGSEGYLNFLNGSPARPNCDREKEGNRNMKIWISCRKKQLIKVELQNESSIK